MQEKWDAVSSLSTRDVIQADYLAPATACEIGDQLLAIGWHLHWAGAALTVKAHGSLRYAMDKAIGITFRARSSYCNSKDFHSEALGDRYTTIHKIST